MEERTYELGLDSFMQVSEGADGRLTDGAEVVRDTVEEGVIAEAVGIDSFNVGEHYRDDMMDSAGHVVLAAIAARTERIRLGTAVTVLSTQDPVRLYNNFATLDAVSGGRAQLILGRGSAIESFPLFGYELREYEEIFEEKLELFASLLRGGRIDWSGRYRPPLHQALMTPPLPTGNLPTWVGSGGSPGSVVRAARYGMPLMLAIIGGRPGRFRSLVDLYRKSLARFGHPTDLPVGVHTLAFVAETDEKAIETQWPYWLRVLTRASRERGFRRPDRRQFDADVTHGALFVGSPETVARRLAEMVRELDLDRVDTLYGVGAVPAAERRRAVELLGQEVFPRMRTLLREDPPERIVVPDGRTFAEVRSPVRTTHAPAEVRE
ncbi:MAG: LLM class flavin-dependent oxidoreductase [Solirubrobacterales bacterium]